jgi:CBS domain-containing protein
MLSQLNRFRVFDESGKHAKLVDLALALLEEDYPPVTQLIIEMDAKPFRIEWASVTAYEPRKRRFIVRDLSEAVETTYESLEADVLMNQDILDALVLDLRIRSTTRANDLQFDDSDRELRLVAADTGLSGMLRRITRGRYRHVSEGALHDWKYVEFLRGDPQAVRNGEGYRMRIGRLPAGEIAQLADYIPYLHAAELIMLLPDPIAADVLEAMTLERQVQVFEELDEKVALDLLARMESDHAADLLGRLRIKDLKRFLKLLPRDKSDRIVQLLRYPEDSIGGVMINDIPVFTADRPIDEVRSELSRSVDRLDFIPLVFLIENDKSRNLVGMVSFKDLLSTEGDGRSIGEIMNPFLETLRPLDSALEGAYHIVSSQVIAMPVTDGSGKLLGAMTFVAAIPQLVPETSTLRAVRIFS